MSSNEIYSKTENEIRDPIAVTTDFEDIHAGLSHHIYQEPQITQLKIPKFYKEVLLKTKCSRFTGFMTVLVVSTISLIIFGFLTVDVYPNISNDFQNYSQAGLTHYWPFDGHMHDVIGGKNAISILDDVFTTDHNGVNKNALELTNDFLSLPLSYFIYDDFTITMLVKIKKYSGNNQVLISITEFANEALHIGLTHFGKNIMCLLYENNYVKLIQSNKTIELNRWTHVTIAVSQSTQNSSVYIDGLLHASLNITSTSTARNYIEKHLSFGSNVNACVDEFKIFNKALADEEVKENVRLAKRRLRYIPQIGTSKSNSYVQYRKTNDLVLLLSNDQIGLEHYWPFNENLIDVVNGLNVKNILNPRYISDRDGNQNSAVDLSQGFIVLQPLSSYVYGIVYGEDYRSLTLAVWIKTKENEETTGTLFGLKKLEIEALLSMNNETVSELYINIESLSFKANMQIELNKWTHLTIVVIRSLKQEGIRAYINGESTVLHPVTQLSFTNKQFNFCLDEFKIFSRELTHDEVKKNMNMRQI